jgi:fatty acid-binding protein DegV
MRLAVLTDASCDLPESFLRHHKVEILPATIRIGDQRVLDERDSIVSTRIYREALSAGRFNVEVQQPSFDQILQRIVDRLMPRYDYVLCIAADATQSPVHRNLTRAAFAALNETSTLRRENPPHPTTFGMRTVDSRATSAALGLLVAETCRLIGEDMPPYDVALHIENLRDGIASFLVPADTARIDMKTRWRDRAAHAWGQRPILHRAAGRYAVAGRGNGVAGAIESVMRLVAAEIRRGLAVPYVVISYGGPTDEIALLPGYESLSLAAREHNVELFPAMMSASRAVSIGGGCTELAYIPRSAA